MKQVTKPTLCRPVKVTTTSGNRYTCYRVDNQKYVIAGTINVMLKHSAIKKWEYKGE